MSDVDPKIVSRIKKMLALGNCMGTTEGERDAAISQAYKLMAKYNLDEAAVKKTDEPEPRGRYSAAGWSMLWCRHAFAAIADLFFCEYAYNNKGGKINATKCYHYFYGRESNAKTAMMVADQVVASILKEGRNRYGDNLCAATRSFATGCVAKLYRRIDKLKEEASQENAPASSCTSLALMNLYESERQANRELMTNVAAAKATKVKDVDPIHYRAGYDHGDKLSLNVQVGQAKRQAIK